MYETFEHTADVGLRVRAADTAGLFVDAGRGLLAVMLENPAAVQPREEVRLHLRADTIEDLWHDWLTELLYTFHGRRLVLADFTVDVCMSGICDDVNADPAETNAPASMVSLDAIVRGEPLDTARHEISLEVKAITWHQLKVDHTTEGWLGEVILDI